MSGDDQKARARTLMQQTRRMNEGLQRATKKLTRGKPQYCKFCGKGVDDARHLLAGADAYICGECVALATEILAEREGYECSPRSRSRPFA